MQTTQRTTPQQAKGSNAIRGQLKRIQHLPSNTLNTDELLKTSMEMPKWNDWSGNWDGDQNSDD